MFPQTILRKIFGTKQRNPVKLDRTKKVWYLLFYVFWLLLPKFNFWKGDWALGYVSTQIKYFPNISLFPQIIGLKTFGNSWRNSYTKFTISDVTFRFTCGQSGLYLNIAKLPNIMTMFVWKFFCCSLHFQQWFQFLEKTFIWFKKGNSLKKPTMSDGRSFSGSMFDLHWTCKIILRQNR